jgi:probable phosphoglycerate mutase
MTDLVLVRHGETIWHDGNRYTGRTDIPLSEHGHRQAERLGRWASTAELDAVWVSPLGRALDTAKPVTAATGLRPRVDQRLVELDFGDGEGLTGHEMSQRFPEARRAFDADPVTHHLPGGEHPVLATDRAKSCLADIAAAFPDGRVLVIGHSTVHRLLLCDLLGLWQADYRRVFPAVRNCGLSTVRWNGTGRSALLEYNVPVDDGAAQAREA